MNNVKSWLKSVARKVIDRNEQFNNYLRKKGAKIGSGVQIVDRWDFKYEPEFADLILLEDNVVIAPGVRFVLHDSAFANVCGDLPIKFGVIHIGKNSYVGAETILLPGIKIGRNCLIGAGSLVNSDIPDDSVAVGRAARIIGSIDDFKARYVEETQKEPNGSSFYVDLGGAYHQQRSKFGSDVVSECKRRYLLAKSKFNVSF